MPTRRRGRADPDRLVQRRNRMKRMSLVLAVGVLAATILSGCVIVPLGGWYGGGEYERGYGRGGYYRNYHQDR